MDNFDPAHKDIKRHAASGFVYSALSQGTRILTQFLSVVIMARLLAPSDFGLVAKVSPIYAFAGMFHDLGLGQATIQRPNLTSAQVNSFFWINVGVGLIITVILLACSPLVGWFYHDPRATYLTIAMALLMGITSLSNQHGALMQRKMAFRHQAIINIIGCFGTLSASILTAVIFHSYWALYAGMAAGTVLPVCGVWFSVKWRPSAPRLAAETKEMLKYGLNITGGNFLGFMVNNINSVVIGRSLGDKLLGLYDRAARLLYSPLQQMIFPISGVVVPILYRLEDNPEKYRRTFLRTIATITLLVIPGIAWLIASSKIAVTTLLGPKWYDAAPVFSILSLAALPQLINSAAEWLIMTQGRSRDFARWSLISAACSFTAIFAGLRYGIVGVAMASTAVQLAQTPIYWMIACRIGPVRFKDVVHALMPQIVGALIVMPALFAFRMYWGAHYALLMLFLGGCLSYVVVIFIVGLFPHGKDMIKENISFGKFILARFGPVKAPRLDV